MGKRGRPRHGGQGAAEEPRYDRSPEPETESEPAPPADEWPTAWHVPEPEPEAVPEPEPEPEPVAADTAPASAPASASDEDSGRDSGRGSRRGSRRDEGDDGDDGDEDEGDDQLHARSRAERRQAARRIKRRRRRSAAREVPILVGVALLIALLLKTFLVQAFVIPSGSMEETIKVGDRVLVDKLTPWFGAEPHRGDVVVFRDPGHWLDNETRPTPDPQGVRQIKDFFTFIGLLPSANEQDLIKRVVAVGGDHVRCCDPQGRIMVNGRALDEPYIAPGNAPSLIKFDVQVPHGRLWVMGDHRGDSADSRYHMDQPGGGTVSQDLVVGKAFVIAWPVSHWRRLQEPATFAGVPRPGAGSAAAQESANNRQDLIQLPTPAELPVVMGVVGLYRVRRGLCRRSEEWKWGTWWSAHGPDPASPRGWARRSVRWRRKGR